MGWGYGLMLVVSFYLWLWTKCPLSHDSNLIACALSAYSQGLFKICCYLDWLHRAYSYIIHLSCPVMWYILTIAMLTLCMLNSKEFHLFLFWNRSHIVLLLWNIDDLYSLISFSSQVATQVGRYVITMMSSGVVLAVGFQLSGQSYTLLVQSTALPLYSSFLLVSYKALVGFQLIMCLPLYLGGDSQTDALIWYSWLGGVIIGTMLGANSVLEEHCKAGPRNVVITGR